MEATVTMSLRDYEDMKDELTLYKRAMEELLTPSKYEFTEKEFLEGKEEYMYVSSKFFGGLSIDTQTLIMDTVLHSLEERYTHRDSEFEVHFEPFYSTLCRISRKENKEKSSE